MQKTKIKKTKANKNKPNLIERKITHICLLISKSEKY